MTDTVLQGAQIIVRAGDVMPAPHIDPFHFGQNVPELLLHRR